MDKRTPNLHEHPSFQHTDKLDGPSPLSEFAFEANSEFNAEYRLQTGDTFNDVNNPIPSYTGPVWRNAEDGNDVLDMDQGPLLQDQPSSPAADAPAFDTDTQLDNFDYSAYLNDPNALDDFTEGPLDLGNLSNPERSNTVAEAGNMVMEADPAKASGDQSSTLGDNAHSFYSNCTDTPKGFPGIEEYLLPSSHSPSPSIKVAQATTSIGVNENPRQTPTKANNIPTQILQDMHIGQGPSNMEGKNMPAYSLRSSVKQKETLGANSSQGNTSINVARGGHGRSQSAVGRGAPTRTRAFTSTNQSNSAPLQFGQYSTPSQKNHLSMQGPPQPVKAAAGFSTLHSGAWTQQPQARLSHAENNGYVPTLMQALGMEPDPSLPRHADVVADMTRVVLWTNQEIARGNVLRGHILALHHRQGRQTTDETWDYIEQLKTGQSVAPQKFDDELLAVQPLRDVKLYPEESQRVIRNLLHQVNIGMVPMSGQQKEAFNAIWADHTNIYRTYFDTVKRNNMRLKMRDTLRSEYQRGLLTPGQGMTSQPTAATQAAIKNPDQGYGGSAPQQMLYYAHSFQSLQNPLGTGKDLNSWETAHTSLNASQNFPPVPPPAQAQRNPAFGANIPQPQPQPFSSPSRSGAPNPFPSRGGHSRHNSNVKPYDRPGPVGRPRLGSGGVGGGQQGERRFSSSLRDQFRKSALGRAGEQNAEGESAVED